jgi:hypothetical protein
VKISKIYRTILLEDSEKIHKSHVDAVCRPRSLGGPSVILWKNTTRHFYTPKWAKTLPYLILFFAGENVDSQRSSGYLFI